MYWKPVLITHTAPSRAHNNARQGRASGPFDRQIYGAVQIDHDYSKPQVKTPTTCLRGDAAANWPEERVLEYREDQVGDPWARALKPPPLFMIGNCLLVWSNRNRGRRAQFTVWRF